MGIEEPGTVDELIADARSAGYDITQRMITDWVARGLLDRPTRQPKGRGRGSGKGLYSPNQRRLLLSLLAKRDSNHIASLARIPIFVWLYWGDEFVPTRQAARAFTTWLGDFRASKDAARQSARLLLGQLAHPLSTHTARRHLIGALSDAAYSGRIDESALRDAVSAVFEPHHALVRRATGPVLAPMTTDTVMDLITVRLAAAQQVRDGTVTEDQLEVARAAHRRHMAEYIAQLPGMAAQVPGHLADAFATPTAQTMAEHCGTDLLTVLGLELRAGAQR